MKQPKLQLDSLSIDKLLDLILILSVLTIVVISVAGYVILPDIIPNGYNSDGDVISYGSKLVLFPLHFLAIIIAFILRWVQRYPHIFNYPFKITEQNVEVQYRLAQRLLMGINIVETWLFAYISYAAFISAKQQHSNINMKVAGIFVILILVIIFNYFRKAKALK